jgi:hypothetical protein
METMVRAQSQDPKSWWKSERIKALKAAQVARQKWEKEKLKQKEEDKSSSLSSPTLSSMNSFDDSESGDDDDDDDDDDDEWRPMRIAVESLTR